MSKRAAMVCCLALAAAPLAAIAEPTRPAAVAPAPRLLPRPLVFAESEAETGAARPPPFVERHRTALTLLGIEAAGTMLASSGYIAEAFDQEPKKGAEFTGGTYAALGGVGGAFGFILSLDPDRKPGDVPAYWVAVSGLIALGIYDLKRAKESPASSEIFRDNMIGINLVVASTAATKWLIGRRSRGANLSR